MTSVDKKRIKSTFSKSRQSYNQQAFIQKKAVDVLMQLLSKHETKFESILEIGCGTGLLTKPLIETLNPSVLTVNDLIDTKTEILEIAKKAAFNNTRFIQGDAENLIFQPAYNLVASASTFQWFSHLPSFLTKTHAVLQEEGYLAFSTYGQQNSLEIKELLKVGLNYYSTQELQEILQPNFVLLEIQETIEELFFDSPIEVLQHFKNTGVNSFSTTTWTKDVLAQFLSDYQFRFGFKNKVRLTYHPIVIVARKR